MTIISVYGFNAKGEVLFLGEASWDASNCVYVTTAGDALALMGKSRSAMRYDDDNGVWVRNRIASFRLDYSTGGSEFCERSAKHDDYCRKVLNERGCTVYPGYAEAKAALATTSV